MKHENPNKRLCVDIFNNIIASFTRIKQILCIAGPVGAGIKKTWLFFRKNIVPFDSEGARAVPSLTNFYRIHNDLKNVF